MTGFRRERRRYPRVKVPLVIRVLDPSIPMDEEVTELSEAGMFKQTSQPQPVGTILAIELKAFGLAKPLLIKGRVVAVVPPGEGWLPGMGIEFLEVPLKERLRLRQVVRMARNMSATVLLVSDDPDFEIMVRWLLADQGQRVYVLHGWKGLSDRPDDLNANLVIFDIGDREIDLEEIRSAFAGMGLVLVGEQFSPDLQTQADAARIFELLPKPVDAQQLLASVRTELQSVGLAEVLNPEESRLRPTPTLVTRSPKMIEVVTRMERLAQEPRPVMIVGDKGTGKEQVAQVMHHYSALAEGPFVAVDCNKLDPGDMLAEIFGDELGHYLRDHSRREGYIDAARDGVLFLGNVEALEDVAQERIASLLSSGIYRRENADRDLRCRCWIIASTDKDLIQATREGRFRKDLLYRLQINLLRLPSLKDRLEDRLPLAHQILEELCQEQKRPIMSFGALAIRQIREYDWPGNVHQLRKVIRNSMKSNQGESIEMLATEGWDDTGHAQADQFTMVRRRLGRIASELGGLGSDLLDRLKDLL